MKVLLVIGALAACGGNQTTTTTTTPPPSTEPPKDLVQPVAMKPTEPTCVVQDEKGIPCSLEFMSYYANLSCECTDAACADDVQGALTAWFESISDKLGDAEATPEQDAEADRIMDKTVACFDKARTPK